MNDDRIRGREYFDVQKPAVELLRDHLGYEHADGQSAEFAQERESTSEVILAGRLAKKLREINPEVPPAVLDAAVDALRRPKATSLLEINEELHTIISRWITLEGRKDGERIHPSVRFIDFEDPERNEFLVVEEFEVKGAGFERRADLVVFMNGIPLAVVECKDPEETHGIKLAIEQLAQYQRESDGIPRLFNTAHFLIALKGRDARYGTIETPLQYFAEWKDPWPMTRDALFDRLGREPTVQDVLLVGLLSKANLLDMVRNFVVFDTEGGRTVKKVARYQQFQAVNLTLKRILERKAAGLEANCGGVVWHTQGSGKSLTMLWLAVKLRRARELENPTLLIVTDRRDLDHQIHQTFMNCGFPNPERAERSAPRKDAAAKAMGRPRASKDLRSLLSGSGGRTVLTTIQKFRDDFDRAPKRINQPVLSEARNIIALVDEAHRTEYGLFAANMRQALPNACHIAFTGTPLIRSERNTVKVFGDYIHRYTMPQSVRDRATVPILYEARMPELHVWGKNLDPIFEAEFAELSAEQRQQVKQQNLRERDIALAESRIEQIAFDIFKHYTQVIEPNGFKGQVVASSHRAAARYYHALERFEQLRGRVAIAISDPTREDGDLVELKNRYKNEKQVIDSFKYDGTEKLALLVVVDKYLTGFDAPVEQVMYLDKRLEDHGLLQAIARVNRNHTTEVRVPDPATGDSVLVEVEKEYGLIVDYWGISENLERALSVFAAEDIDPRSVWTRRDGDEAFLDLKQRRREVFSIFPPGLTFDSLEPWVVALGPEDRRADFERASRAFFKALDRVLPDPRGLDYLVDAKWLEDVRRKVRRDYYVEDLAVSAASAKVRKLIDQHVKVEEIVQLLEPVPILSDRFAEEVGKLTSPAAKTERMLHAIWAQVNENLPTDPALYESVRGRLERIIAERKAARLNEVEAFKQLMIEYERLREAGEGPSEWAGHSPHASAFFHLLEARLDGAGTAGPEREARKELTENIIAAIQNDAVIDWVQKEDIQRTMRRNVKRQLRAARWPDEKLDETVTAVMDLARARLGNR